MRNARVSTNTQRLFLHMFLARLERFEYDEPHSGGSGSSWSGADGASVDAELERGAEAGRLAAQDANVHQLLQGRLREEDDSQRSRTDTRYTHNIPDTILCVKFSACGRVK